MRLESLGSGTLSVCTDSNGGFKFTSLAAGSYTVVVEATEQFEGTRESVFIDQRRGRGVVRDSTPRVYTVYLHLREKRAAAPGETRPHTTRAPAHHPASGERGRGLRRDPFPF